MRVLILSDIHGNLPALEMVLNSNIDVQYIITLGDNVNYGPWSNECVKMLDSMENTINILGNHETCFLNGIYNGINPVANAFFNFCYPRFNEHSIIRSYFNEYVFLGHRFVHTINDKYIYEDTSVQLDENIFIGHSHCMFVKNINGYRLVNVGSVGQNRKNLDEVNYVIWETGKNEVKLCSKKFSSKILINEMKKNKYPEICMNYILSKKQ